MLEVVTRSNVTKLKWAKGHMEFYSVVLIIVATTPQSMLEHRRVTKAQFCSSSPSNTHSPFRYCRFKTKYTFSRLLNEKYTKEVHQVLKKNKKSTKEGHQILH